MVLSRVGTFRYLLLLGFILLPFMSLPVLPSDYRPVSVLIFLVTGFFLLLTRASERRMPIDEFLLLCFFVLCVFQTVALVGVVAGDHAKALRHLIVLLLGILSYVSLKALFRLYGLDSSLRLMAGVYVLIFAIGVLELLSIMHVLPWSVKAGITHLLSGRTVQRMQLVTSEASWAAKVLLFGIPIYVFLLFRSKRLGYLLGAVVGVVLLCITLSLDGFMAAGIAVLIFAAVKFRVLIRNPKLSLALILSLATLVGVFYLAYRAFPKGRTYYMARLQTLETMDMAKIREIPRKDTSVFIRVYYPLMGVWMFLDKPLGTGLGGYSVHFKEFLDQVKIDYTHFPEVIGDIRTRTGDPKSLYSKFLSENGLYSGWLLIFFLVLHLYYLKRIPRDGIIPYKNLLIALLAVNAAILFQFGSYAFLPMWFTLALNAEVWRLRSVQVRV